MNALLQKLSELPLADMGEIFSLLATRVYEHRLANGGRVPLSLFESCIGLGGLSVSFQVDNDVVDDHGRHIGFAMKLREESEAGFQGQYHNTCCVGLLSDTATSGFDRDTRETFGMVPAHEMLELLGITIHDQPARRSSCLTVMKRRKVTAPEVSKFIGTWRIFSDREIHQYPKNIVAADCYRLEWVMDSNRPFIADIRGGWWPKKDAGEPRPSLDDQLAQG